MQTAYHILVVDDNAPFRMLMQAFLEKNGYHVTSAENGEQALDIIAARTVDLILLDLQMLPVGGFDFMRIYVERGYSTPVILITGDPSSDILARATQQGFGAVIKKPVDEHRLLTAVARFLSR